MIELPKCGVCIEMGRPGNSTLIKDSEIELHYLICGYGHIIRQLNKIEAEEIKNEKLLHL